MNDSRSEFLTRPTDITAPASVAAESTVKLSPLELRLDFGVVYWRVTVLLTIIATLQVIWTLARRRIRGAWIALAMIRFFPRIVVYAMISGLIVSLVLGILVRFVIRPLARQWLSPRGPSLEECAFQLGAGELTRASRPARLRWSRFWLGGIMIVTQRTLWFFPHSWQHEVWSTPLDQIREASLVPTPKFFLGMVVGMPDRVRLTLKSGSQPLFALLDPIRLLEELGFRHVTESARNPREQADLVPAARSL